MRFKQLWIVGLLGILFCIGSFYTVNEVDKHAQQYHTSMQAHVKVLEFKSRLLNTEEWQLLLTDAMIYKQEDEVWTEKKKQAEAELLKANRAYETLEDTSMTLVYLAIGLLLVTIFLYAGDTAFLKAMAVAFTAISLSFLYLGVKVPMLEISAFNENLKLPIIIKTEHFGKKIDDKWNEGAEFVDGWLDYMGADVKVPKSGLAEELAKKYLTYEGEVTFEGRIYYYYQSKSILSLIDLLYKDKNYTVGMAILLFSIVIPVIKMFFTMLLLFIPRLRKNSSLMISIKAIGKWSMADVFVAASFLTYLSFYNMNVGIETESKVLVGLHFFLTYVLISMLATLLIWISHKRNNKELISLNTAPQLENKGGGIG